jgi:hypothetical protein
VGILINTDVAGRIYVDHSADGKTATRTATFPVLGGTGEFFGVAPRARYVRLRYKNGGVVQQTFVLQTILNAGAKGFTFFPISTPLLDSIHALVTRTIISGKNSTTNFYENVELDDGKNLRVTSIQHVTPDPLNSSSDNLEGGPADWNPAVTYALMDLVYWKGVNWRSIANNNLNKEPVEGAWWVEMTQVSWDATVTYAVNSIVQFDHVTWASIQNGNLNHAPTDSAWWKKFHHNMFVGDTASTLGVAGIQVTLKTDTSCTVFVDQSPDGVNWDITDKYVYNPLKANFGLTVQAVASYFRVRVRNEDSIASTYFRLQTCLCPVVEAVPRSLD